VIGFLHFFRLSGVRRIETDLNIRRTDMNEQNMHNEITDLEAANAEAIKGGPRLTITKGGTFEEEGLVDLEPNGDVVGGTDPGYKLNHNETMTEDASYGLADLEAPNTEEVKGGPTTKDIRNVRIKTTIPPSVEEE
jgi:hypothetical protein